MESCYKIYLMACRLLERDPPFHFYTFFSSDDSEVVCKNTPLSESIPFRVLLVDLLFQIGRPDTFEGSHGRVDILNVTNCSLRIKSGV